MMSLGLAALALLAAPAAWADAEAVFGQGLARYEQGDYQAAAERFRESLTEDPSFVEAQKYLGRALAQLGQWIDAIEQMKRAYELLPESEKRVFVRELWETIVRGILSMLDAGRLDQAVEVLRGALELSGQDEGTRDQLARVFIAYGGELLAQGRLEEALGAFAEAQALRIEAEESF
jgi:tetratricopeptide (TPR) repeat protein